MTQRERLGKYEILEVLGRGAMGVVFKGFDPGIDRTVAIKTVRKELIEDDDRAGMALARFRNEARAAGRLSHPGIVAVYDYGESDAVTYIAMEYVQGNSLREYFNAGTRFGEADVVSIMAQLLEALQHAHEAGVWHRDVKPANLIIMANGRLKIADFGIARIEASQLTQTGVVMGSPGYMAPEQYAGGTIDWRADLFAAAVVMHQLLTGERLYTGSAEQVAYKICHQEPPSPSTVDPGKGWERYDLLLQRALAKNPDHRFSSASAFREAILQAYAAPVSAAVSEETILATTTRPAGVFEPSNPSARTGDPSASAGSRTPTPPPLSPPPVPATAQTASPARHVSAPSVKRNWPILAGAAAAAVAGAFLGAWWVSRGPATPSLSEQPVSVQSAGMATGTPVVEPVPPAIAKPAVPEKPKAVPIESASKAERSPAAEPRRIAKPETASASRPTPEKKANSPRPREPRKIESREPTPKSPRKVEMARTPQPASAPASPASPAAARAPAVSRPEGTSGASPVGAPVQAPAITASVSSAKAATGSESAAVGTASLTTENAPTASEQPAPEPAKPPPPPPSIWRDQGITMKIASKIQFNRRLWSSGIQVETVDGVVTLRGAVSSPELSAEAERIAADVYGVHAVKNEIKINP